MGAVLAALLAVHLGFGAVVLLALACYTAAAAALPRAHYSSALRPGAIPLTLID